VSRISKTLLIAGALGLAVTAIPAQAEQGDWLLKGGVTTVSPDSNNLKVVDGEDVLKLSVGDGTSFGFTITQMVTDNFGVELLAAWPFKHDIKAKVNGGGLGKIAEVEHLPPTLSLQYHFLPDTFLTPYVGVGVNWTTFTSEKINSGVADGLSLDDSFGLAGQVGVDLNLGDWILNADVRYIDISSKAKIKVDGEWSKLGTVSIDPIVYSLMVGYRF